MIQLYGMGSPNVVKVMVMLEECGLAWEFKRINVLAGEQFSASFRLLNPNSKVPVIVDDEVPGSPLALSESGAILQYLAEKAGLLSPTCPVARALVNQWLMFQMAGFGPMSGQAIHFHYATKDDSYARNRYYNELNRLITVVDQRLSHSAYVAGDNYSIADIALFPWIRTLQKFFAKEVDQPGINRWFQGLSERPAVVRAIAFASSLSERDMSELQQADRPARDRYFGRVPYPND
jgi:GST-like protein